MQLVLQPATEREDGRPGQPGVFVHGFMLVALVRLAEAEHQVKNELEHRDEHRFVRIPRHHGVLLYAMFSCLLSLALRRTGKK